ncbi:MAG: beta-lactamase family protein [Planctomycetes bacterium]|nr:beta-lactamase family protein [Planctomycetota bacterium]
MMRFRCLLLAALFLIGAFLDRAGIGAAEATKALPCCQATEAGMDAAVLAKIPERMRGFVEEHQVAGVVTLVARRGCVVHLEAVGWANVEGEKPMEKDSVFAIASMTKPVTATALMILQDEGKLSVDDPVAKYIPAFADVALASGPPSRAITIRDLMTHTAGLSGSQRTEGTLEETVAEIVKRSLVFQPGSKWLYSPGMTVCGRIIEIVSGKAYDEFLAERIFQPLGMADTSFHPTGECVKRIVKLYKPGDDGKSIQVVSHWLVDDSGTRAPNPSGGLFSTASDMARFYQMILNGGELDGCRIVSKAAVEQMTRVATPDLTTGFTPGNGWGLGWCIVREPQGVTKMLSPGTHGHGGAFGTQGWVDPVRKMVFVMMIQRTGFGNGDASDLRGAFQTLAVEAVRE